jgi:hypothetical protein
MGTLKEMVYNIRNLISLKSDDFNISDDQIAYWINTERALLLREYIKAEQSLSPEIVQTLKCVPVQCVDPIECCDQNLFSDFKILRTIPEIPIPITISSTNFHNPVLITFVGTVDRNRVFEFTSESIVLWGKYNKYTKNLPRAFFKNKYIYIRNYEFPGDIGYISVSGVFLNPEEVNIFNLCNAEQGCDYEQSVEEALYPVPSHLIPIIFDVIFKKYFNIAINVKEDFTNNAKNDVKNEIPR